jgi:phosphatidylinositol-4,5-bisphosphate 3-kinase
MDRIWLDEGLDLRMKPYRVVATADNVGMIEIVQDSMTISKIQKKVSGKFGAFVKETIKDYLRENSKDDQEFEKSIDNFIRSCAGYSVATYIIGIGDRHNSNIMITSSGHLFHIDFGHFLGHWKSKFGIQREGGSSKFVFTDAMLHAMGGRNSPGFKQYKRYSTTAFNLIRKNGWRLITLLQLMLCAELPELESTVDIGYLRGQMCLHLTEIEAKNLFKKEIKNSLNNIFRKIDAFFHDNKHK